MSWMPSEESVAKRKKPSTVSSAPENYGRTGTGGPLADLDNGAINDLDKKAKQSVFKSVDLTCQEFCHRQRQGSRSW